jgi:hypothetical protein
MAAPAHASVAAFRQKPVVRAPGRGPQAHVRGRGRSPTRSRVCWAWPGADHPVPQARGGNLDHGGRRRFDERADRRATFLPAIGPPRQQERLPTVSADVVANRLTIRRTAPQQPVPSSVRRRPDRVKIPIREHLDVRCLTGEDRGANGDPDRNARGDCAVGWGGAQEMRARRRWSGRASIAEHRRGIPPSNFTPINPNLVGPANSLLPSHR